MISRQFVERLDRAVLCSMLCALPRNGVLNSSLRIDSTGEILRCAAVAPQHRRLIERWLRVLSDRGWIGVESGGFRGAQTLDSCIVQDAWRDARTAWSAQFGGTEFIDYIESNACRLSQLITGEQHAVLLLFPEGRSEIARAVYEGTVTARYLNTAVSSLVGQMVNESGRTSPLRVMEVGAGTGATTLAVVEALREDGAHKAGDRLPFYRCFELLSLCDEASHE